MLAVISLNFFFCFVSAFILCFCKTLLFLLQAVSSASVITDRLCIASGKDIPELISATQANACVRPTFTAAQKYVKLSEYGTEWVHRNSGKMYLDRRHTSKKGKTRVFEVVFHWRCNVC